MSQGHRQEWDTVPAQIVYGPHGKNPPLLERDMAPPRPEHLWSDPMGTCFHGRAWVSLQTGSRVRQAPWGWPFYWTAPHFLQRTPLCSQREHPRMWVGWKVSQESWWQEVILTYSKGTENCTRREDSGNKATLGKYTEVVTWQGATKSSPSTEYVEQDRWKGRGNQSRMMLVLDNCHTWSLSHSHFRDPRELLHFAVSLK